MTSHSKTAQNKPGPNWRDVLDIHPAAELFPLMSKTDPAALKELAEDIKKHGLRSPIALISRNGKKLLIDGRNRLDALALAGFEVIKNGKLNEDIFGGKHGRGYYYNAKLCFDCTDAEITSLVISANIHRRHLSAEQKRKLIAELIKLHPEKSDRAHAADLKVDKNVVSRARKKVEATGAGAPVEKRTGRDGKARRMPAKTKKPETNGVATPLIWEGSEVSGFASTEFDADDRQYRIVPLGKNGTFNVDEYMRGDPAPSRRLKLNVKTLDAAKAIAQADHETKTTSAATASQIMPGDIGPMFNVEDPANEIMRLRKQIIGLEDELDTLRKENADLREMLAVKGEPADVMKNSMVKRREGTAQGKDDTNDAPRAGRIPKYDCSAPVRAARSNMSKIRHRCSQCFLPSG
jgi:ParB-like nuclease domain